MDGNKVLWSLFRLHHKNILRKENPPSTHKKIVNRSCELLNKSYENLMKP